MADVRLVGNGDAAWASQFPGGAFYLYRFAAVLSGIVNKIRVVGVAVGSSQVMVALYTDIAGAPGALLAGTTSPYTIVYGENYISISQVPIVAGTFYWLAFIGEYNIINRASGTQTRRYKSVAFSGFAFPNPAGSGYTAGSEWYPAISGWGTVGGASVGLIGDGPTCDRVLFGCETLFG